MKHTVTFDVNGGNETYSSREYQAGVTLTDLPTPTRDGYEFDGWKDSDGYEYFVGSVMPENDLTLYAMWTLVEYNIIYVLNGGENNSENRQ